MTKPQEYSRAPNKTIILPEKLVHSELHLPLAEEFGDIKGFDLLSRLVADHTQKQETLVKDSSQDSRINLPIDLSIDFLQLRPKHIIS